MLQSIFKLTPPYKYPVAICCIAKHEDPYLTEWIDYHLKIGVSRFYIYDNESSIPISTTLSAYIKKGVVVVEPISGMVKQMPAYSHCIANYGSECQWIAFIDVDEFIVPKTLTGNLPEFLDNYKSYGGLGIHWLVFGSNGHLEKPQGSQLESYTRRSLKTEGVNGHIKSIVQPRYVKGVPNPHYFHYKRGKYCVNEDFERINGAIAKHTSNKIQLNHYFLRSLEEFKLKIARGRADNGETRNLDEFYFVDKLSNLITDENIIELKLVLEKENAN
ncbi:MAG: glycosyltransferase family 92 protein [Mucilaginibacter sp.]|uniref:glycosyltransferase family 92 protein n=1 Tax=Mucilaginibacter sp. TaxID=1882438 RepID=UPI0031B1500D